MTSIVDDQLATLSWLETENQTVLVPIAEIALQRARLVQPVSVFCPLPQTSHLIKDGIEATRQRLLRLKRLSESGELPSHSVSFASSSSSRSSSAASTPARSSPSASPSSQSQASTSAPSQRSSTLDDDDDDDFEPKEIIEFVPPGGKLLVRERPMLSEAEVNEIVKNMKFVPRPQRSREEEEEMERKFQELLREEEAAGEGCDDDDDSGENDGDEVEQSAQSNEPKLNSTPAATIAKAPVSQARQGSEIRPATISTVFSDDLVVNDDDFLSDF